MKNIKLRIVYLILCSALLLFALFMLAVNLIIPAHFVREAKKALISEAQYQNRTIPYTDDGSFFDDEWNDAEEHFLTPSIVFLELDNANQSSGWNTTHGIGIPTGWRKSCWNTAPGGISHSASAIPSKRTNIT